ncbi:hypothetical protein OAB57_03560, partial [Bacteriovoracaceae bacterium]|nr:hypothetical protein [Bacteriovoracaceae bacterium]
YIKLKDKKRSQSLYKKLKALKGKKRDTLFSNFVSTHSLSKKETNNLGKWAQPISDKTPFRQNLGENHPQITPKVLKAKQNELLQPILSQGHYYIVKVDRTIKAQSFDYEKIKDQVKNDYAATKQQSLYQGLIENTLKTQNVQFFLENIK